MTALHYLDVAKNAMLGGNWYAKFRSPAGRACRRDWRTDVEEADLVTAAAFLFSSSRRRGRKCREESALLAPLLMPISIASGRISTLVAQNGFKTASLCAFSLSTVRTMHHSADVCSTVKAQEPAQAKEELTEKPSHRKSAPSSTSQ